MSQAIVNLVTRSKILEDLILSEYPGLLFKEQIEKKGEGEDKIYLFRNLDYNELNMFLSKELKNYGFMIY